MNYRLCDDDLYERQHEGYAWIRPPRKGRASTWYGTRHAEPPVEEGWKQALPPVDVDDEKTKALIGAFNDLVHKHQVCPAQTLPHDGRRTKMAALQEEARTELGIYDVSDFVKTVVWPFCRQGGDLSLVGFHYFEDFLPAKSVKHEDVESAVLPEGYAWEDNDPKHQQNREVCTHGATLLDREQLKPAECESLPLPPLVASEVVPRLQTHLRKLNLPAELDFLYANRYRQAKGGYIRFHHDQLTKMGPVVVGVSLGATAHMSYVRTCTPDTKLPGSDGSVEVEMVAGSMYVMSGISRYGLKHGVLDASSNGDRVSLTFREVTKPLSNAEGLWKWRRKASEVMGPMVKHPAALRCKCCRTTTTATTTTTSSSSSTSSMSKPTTAATTTDSSTKKRPSSSPPSTSSLSSLDSTGTSEDEDEEEEEVDEKREDEDEGCSDDSGSSYGSRRSDSSRSDEERGSAKKARTQEVDADHHLERGRDHVAADDGDDDDDCGDKESGEDGSEMKSEDDGDEEVEEGDVDEKAPDEDESEEDADEGESGEEETRDGLVVDENEASGSDEPISDSEEMKPDGGESESDSEDDFRQIMTFLE